MHRPLHPRPLVRPVIPTLRLGDCTVYFPCDFDDGRDDDPRVRRIRWHIHLRLRRMAMAQWERTLPHSCPSAPARQG